MFLNKFNGEVTVKLSINNGKIRSVSFDNGKQPISYEAVQETVAEKDEAYYVEDISSMLEEYLENCCVSTDD